MNLALLVAALLLQPEPLPRIPRVPNAVPATQPAPLIPDGKYRFRVERTYDRKRCGEMLHEGDALSDECFVVAKNEPACLLVLSDAGQRAELSWEGRKLEGRRSLRTNGPGEAADVFGLNRGTLAGARLRVSEGARGKSPQAELVIFGSGVPLIAALRGSLEAL